MRRFGVSNMGAVQMAALQARLDAPLVAYQLEMSLQPARLARSRRPREHHGSRDERLSVRNGRVLPGETAFPCRRGDHWRGVASPAGKRRRRSTRPPS
ncbi:hypothetical protein [Streptomyces sp. NPDC005408]|uniref:hypothetical protein n=1 Tax=Streptomyces sp. NPDC005408 TaxID=3155341 RepID=UPI0033B5F346